jgi:predicted dehydrogenase
MNRVAILGSGFGLYGYLPAVMNGCGKQVILPERYRQRLESRADVKHLVDRVEWVPDELSALDRADAVVMSQRPEDQMARVRDCLDRENIKGILLEKPLAPNPLQAQRVLRQLDDSNKRLRIGYTFRYTNWGCDLLNWKNARTADGILRVSWSFGASHYASDSRVWKRYSSAGGGALRFYGIHLIALLAEIGYDEAVMSVIAADLPDEAEKWRAVIVGAGLPDCHLHLDSRAAVDRFLVCSEGKGGANLCVQLTDPFEQSLKNGVLDRRIDVLTQLCQDLFSGGELSYPWYSGSVALWGNVEERTNYVSCARFDN